MQQTNKHYYWQEDTLILHCHIQPKASKNEVVGLHNNAVKVRLSAPPVDGKANRQLLAYLGELFAVPKQHIQLLKGEHSRQKTVAIRQPGQLPSNTYICSNDTPSTH